MNKDRYLRHHFFVKHILSFYRENKRNLPWRRENISAYEVWVSEIMLQQTQVSRVGEYYARFLKRFPSVEELAQVSWEEFLPYYEGLGYYNRGRNMLKTAKIVIEEYNGVFPQDKKELEKLPGIGRYTASAIASFAYEKTVLAWDTNFQRVFGRFFEGSKDEVMNREEMEGIVKKGIKNYEDNTCGGEAKISKENKEIRSDDERKKFRVLRLGFREFNAGVMDFGSLVCTKNPKCTQCPLRKHCVYYKTMGKKEVQKKIFQEDFPTKQAFAYVILHENHKIYFSRSKKIFKPFRLSPEENSREAIKYFFENHYQLKISVRPPKMKLYIKERPTMVVYAQILSGRHNFSSFPQEAVRDTINKWI